MHGKGLCWGDALIFCQVFAAAGAAGCGGVNGEEGVGMADGGV